jgi:hypothetical protein
MDFKNIIENHRKNLTNVKTNFVGFLVTRSTTFANPDPTFD